MPETNVKQATLIPSAEAVSNPLGTAPGWWVERDGSILVAMPGPPRELARMWTHEVAPRLKQRNPGVAIVTRTLKTFGISEGGLDEMLAPLFQVANPNLGIYSKEDGIHLRAIATAETEDVARSLIEPMEAEIRRIIADDAIWGEDDETAISQTATLLTERGWTLGIMESFTGGLLASNLAEAPGAESFLRGSLVVNGGTALATQGVDPRIVERPSAATADLAEAMADAARRQFDADVGVGVTALVTDPTPTSGPVGTSHIGISVDGRTTSTSGRYPTQRLRIRSRAVTHTLLELIRVLRS